MVAGCPVRMPNWLNIASRMTASAIHNKICFVRSFKFHLQPMSHYDNESIGAFPKADALTAPYRLDPIAGPPNLHHPKLPRQQIDLRTAGSRRFRLFGRHPTIAAASIPDDLFESCTLK